MEQPLSACCRIDIKDVVLPCNRQDLCVLKARPYSDRHPDIDHQERFCWNKGLASPSRLRR